MLYTVMSKTTTAGSVSLKIYEKKWRSKGMWQENYWSIYIQLNQLIVFKLLFCSKSKVYKIKGLADSYEMSLGSDTTFHWATELHGIQWCNHGESQPYKK